MKSFDPRQLLRDMFDAAVAAAQPALCVPRHLPAVPKGRLIVIGTGKASAAMARRGPLARAVVRAGGHQVRLLGALQAHRDRRGCAPGARAFAIAASFDLDTRVVSYGTPPPELLELVSASS